MFVLVVFKKVSVWLYISILIDWYKNVIVSVSCILFNKKGIIFVYYFLMLKGFFKFIVYILSDIRDVFVLKCYYRGCR